MNQIALALRSELYRPEEIAEFAKLADSSSGFSHIFYPDIPGAQESIELCASCLAITKRIRAGSGVVRLLEHESRILIRRLSTIQWVSDNRFTLGIGTGSPGPNPAQTIEKMFSILEEIKKGFPSKFGGKDLLVPEILVASLKSGIAIKSIGHSDGLILNFCSPRYAEQLLSKVRNAGGRMKSIVCYFKVFFSEKDSTATRLLAEEFAKYNMLPQYHAMFEKDRVLDFIMSVSNALSKESFVIPDKIKEISLANPSMEELLQGVERFRKAGINIPCVYPYFGTNETTQFKTQVLKEITNAF
jgi:Luciferase-like monooxygenase